MLPFFASILLALALGALCAVRKFLVVTFFITVALMASWVWCATENPAMAITAIVVSLGLVLSGIWAHGFMKRRYILQPDDAVLRTDIISFGERIGKLDLNIETIHRELKAALALHERLIALSEREKIQQLDAMLLNELLVKVDMALFKALSASFNKMVLERGVEREIKNLKDELN